MGWVRRDAQAKICEWARNPAPHLSEELADDNAEVVAYLHPAQPPGAAARAATDEQERSDCKLDATIMGLVDQTRAQWRTWAGTNFPTLTAPERTRLGDLFWVVSIGVRRVVRNGG